MKITTKVKLKFYSTSKELLGRAIAKLNYWWLLAVSAEADILDGWKK